MHTIINTTHGPIDDATLAYTVIFEERPKELVVAREWRLLDHDGVGCAVCGDQGNPRPIAGAVLVRRDAHVILKEPSVTATAIAASLG